MSHLIDVEQAVEAVRSSWVYGEAVTVDALRGIGDALDGIGKWMMGVER